jgi:hypothetical protein
LQQVIHGRHLVVLVAIQTLRRIVFLEAVAFEISEEGGFDWNFVFANNQSLAFADWFVSLIPWVLLYLLRRQPFVGVCL